jgi:sugar O-acyltransferase (sialic acid O-acetyltransferase NeuD family)
MKRFAVFGASGCGRGVLPLVRQHLASSSIDEWDLVFVDDNPPAPTVNGHRVLTYADWLAEEGEEHRISLAIANSKIREQLANRCETDGVGFFEVRACNVVELDDVEIGEGAILCPFVTVTSNVRIGRHFHANLYSYVEHDCRIGDFVTFAPGVKCNGNITIEDHAYIGAGAMIKQGVPGRPLLIGRGAVIGMGAVVTKDVPSDSVVAGNPARALTKK